jgi:hypothetical protein
VKKTGYISTPGGLACQKLLINDSANALCSSKRPMKALLKLRLNNCRDRLLFLAKQGSSLVNYLG